MRGAASPARTAAGPTPSARAMPAPRVAMVAHIEAASAVALLRDG
jgi:hypothetical protein